MKMFILCIQNAGNSPGFWLSVLAVGLTVYDKSQTPPSTVQATGLLPAALIAVRTHSTTTSAGEMR